MASTNSIFMALPTPPVGSARGPNPATDDVAADGLERKDSPCSVVFIDSSSMADGLGSSEPGADDASALFPGGRGISGEDVACLFFVLFDFFDIFFFLAGQSR
uniref:Uncharacterized protein n=1 Tax=Caenorhabditis japonica TaxID=281687 RepID=A0A8R1EAE6_CAEJA